MPKQETLKEFMQTTSFYSSVGYEEKMITEILTESEQLLKDENFDNAIWLLNEGGRMDRWKYVYGAHLNLNLAFAYAMKGNFTLAQNKFDEIMVDYGTEFLEEEQKERLKDVEMMIDQNSLIEKNEEGEEEEVTPSSPKG